MEAHLVLPPGFAAKAKEVLDAAGYSPADVTAVQHKIGDGTLLKLILANLPAILDLLKGFGLGIPTPPVAGS